MSTWEIRQFNNDVEVLKETGPMGRFIFELKEYPGLGHEAARIRATITVAPELLVSLKAMIAPYAGLDADAIDKGYGWHKSSVVLEARAIIAKAEA